MTRVIVKRGVFLTLKYLHYCDMKTTFDFLPKTSCVNAIKRSEGFWVNLSVFSMLENSFFYITPKLHTWPPSSLAFEKEKAMVAKRFRRTAINGEILLLCHFARIWLERRDSRLHVWHAVLPLAFSTVPHCSALVCVRDAFVSEAVRAGKWLLKARNLSTWRSNCWAIKNY